MAEVDHTGVVENDDRTFQVTWEGLGQGDTGLPVALGRYADKTAQVIGDFSGTATIVWQGSLNGGTNWFTVHDPQGNATAMGDDTGIVLAENPLLLRPSVASGDGSTDIDVFLCGAVRGV